MTSIEWLHAQVRRPPRVSLSKQPSRITVRRIVSTGARLGFMVWLYVVTDGAAFAPFSWLGDVVGGSVWQPVLAVAGLVEVVARVGAKATGRD